MKAVAQRKRAYPPCSYHGKICYLGHFLMTRFPSVVVLDIAGGFSVEKCLCLMIK